MTNYELQQDIDSEKEKPVTIKDIVEDKTTIEKLDILTRADKVFKDRAGRYYGGFITKEEASLLNPPKIKFKKHE